MSNLISLEKLQYSSVPGPLSILPIFKDKNTLLGKSTVEKISKIFSVQKLTVEIDNTIRVKSLQETINFSILANDVKLDTCTILLPSGEWQVLEATDYIFTCEAEEFYIPLYEYTNILVTFNNSEISEIDIFGDEFIGLNFNNTSIKADCISLLNCPNIKNIDGTLHSSLIKKILSPFGVYTNITSLPLT